MRTSESGDEDKDEEDEEDEEDEKKSRRKPHVPPLMKVLDGDEDGDEKDQEDDEEDEDGIVFNDIDDEYFCNMNRIAKMKIEDSEDESDQDSD